MNKFKKYYPFFLSILTSILKHVCVFLTFLVVKTLFFYFGPRFSPEEIIIWSSLVMITVYLSTAFAFAVYNKKQFNIFSNKETKSIISGFISFDFIFDTIASCLFFFVIYPKGTTILASLVSIGANFAVYAFSRAHFINLLSHKKNSYLFVAKLIVHLVIAVPGLFILFFLISYFIPTVSTIIMVLKLISYTLIIPAVIAVFLYVRALSKMSKFLKKLKKYCKEKRIDVPKLKSPYLSVFVARPKNTFQIDINGKTFECNIISFTNIFRPVIFRSDGYYYRISARALKRNDGPSMLIESSYTFDSPHQKAIIMPSTPYVVKLREGNASKTFDMGDMCGGYKLFTPEGFFRAAERNTINRKTFD